jgi:hypothetical protein
VESIRIIRCDQPRRPSGAQSRNLRNRITCAYSQAERAAIEWLNRTPERDELRGVLKSLRGKPRRQIAKELNAVGLAKLVEIHAAVASPGRELVPVSSECRD